MTNPPSPTALPRTAFKNIDSLFEINEMNVVHDEGRTDRAALLSGEQRSAVIASRVDRRTRSMTRSIDRLYTCQPFQRKREGGVGEKQHTISECPGLLGINLITHPASALCQVTWELYDWLLAVRLR